MVKNKTTETNNSVAAYTAAIADEKRRRDTVSLIQLIADTTGFDPKMWGTGIVGFGSYHYQYESGHEGDAPLAAIACRSNAITLYLATDFEKKESLLQQFGKHKTGKGCIYIQKLEDINTTILATMIKNSVQRIRQQYPG